MSSCVISTLQGSLPENVNALQGTATHWNTLKHTAPHCNSLQHSETHENTPKKIAANHGTEWQRPIGCLKLQVIFRKRATMYRALLRKLTCKDKASYSLRHLVSHHHWIQHTTLHYINTTLYHTTSHYIAPQHTTTHYNILYHTTPHYNTYGCSFRIGSCHTYERVMSHSTHTYIYATLQDTTAHYTTPQHIWLFLHIYVQHTWLFSEHKHHTHKRTDVHICTCKHMYIYVYVYTYYTYT